MSLHPIDEQSDPEPLSKATKQPNKLHQQQPDQTDLHKSVKDSKRLKNVTASPVKKKDTTPLISKKQHSAENVEEY